MRTQTLTLRPTALTEELMLLTSTNAGALVQSALGGGGLGASSLHPLLSSTEMRTIVTSRTRALVGALTAQSDMLSKRGTHSLITPAIGADRASHEQNAISFSATGQVSGMQLKGLEQNARAVVAPLAVHIDGVAVSLLAAYGSLLGVWAASVKPTLAARKAKVETQKAMLAGKISTVDTTVDVDASYEGGANVKIKGALEQFLFEFKEEEILWAGKIWRRVVITVEAKKKQKTSGKVEKGATHIEKCSWVLCHVIILKKDHSIWCSVAGQLARYIFSAPDGGQKTVPHFMPEEEPKDAWFDHEIMIDAHEVRTRDIPGISARLAWSPGGPLTKTTTKMDKMLLMRQLFGGAPVELLGYGVRGMVGSKKVVATSTPQPPEVSILDDPPEDSLKSDSRPAISEIAKRMAVAKERKDVRERKRAGLVEAVAKPARSASAIAHVVHPVDKVADKAGVGAIVAPVDIVAGKTGAVVGDVEGKGRGKVGEVKEADPHVAKLAGKGSSVKEKGVGTVGGATGKTGAVVGDVRGKGRSERDRIKEKGDLVGAKVGVATPHPFVEFADKAESAPNGHWRTGLVLDVVDDVDVLHVGVGGVVKGVIGAGGDKGPSSVRDMLHESASDAPEQSQRIKGVEGSDFVLLDLSLRWDLLDVEGAETARGKFHFAYEPDPEDCQLLAISSTWHQFEHLDSVLTGLTWRPPCDAFLTLRPPSQLLATEGEAAHLLVPFSMGSIDKSTTLERAGFGFPGAPKPVATPHAGDLQQLLNDPWLNEESSPRMLTEAAAQGRVTDDGYVDEDGEPVVPLGSGEGGRRPSLLGNMLSKVSRSKKAYGAAYAVTK